MLSERYTERARKALLAAQDWAYRLHSSYVSSEHILLGLIDEEGIASQILERLDVDIMQLRNELETRHRQSGPPPEAEPPLAPPAKRVLMLSNEEAKEMRDTHIGTEHLLLALLRDQQGTAYKTLRRHGIRYEQIRRRVSDARGEESDESPRKRKRSTTPALDAFSRDLTQLATDDKLDPVIGRDDEMARVIQILSRRTKNNPVLVGDAGVGKTAIVEGLALRINAKDVPEPLIGKRLVQLDLAAMVAGTKYRGEFEERMKRVMNEVSASSGNILIFIDELHTIVGAGAAEGAIDASNMLKPALARGELHCIGATTIDEYRRHIEKHAALERRFQPVFVSEPSLEDTVEILRGLRGTYEKFHNVRIDDAGLEAAARLSHRYLTERQLPDKGIDVIDEAASRVKLRFAMPPKQIREVSKEFDNINEAKEEAVNEQDFERATRLRDRATKLQERLDELQDNWQNQQLEEAPVVSEEDIATIVSEWSGVPVTRLTDDETERLLHMEESIADRVVGQKEAVQLVSKAIRRARAGLKDPRRPSGTFVFLGPTGVGKTLLGRALAEFLFGSEDSLIRIDMSEYRDRHTMSRLIGSPPGYVGYEEGGQLTERIRRQPFSVVLFDEFDRAHHEVTDILLQIMDEGRLTDAQGRNIDFKNAVIIMTSNIGYRGFAKEMEGSQLGFVTEDVEAAEERAFLDLRKKMSKLYEERFTPEFRNRVDEVLIFEPLTKEDMLQIVDIELKSVRDELEVKAIQLELTREARSRLVDIGYSKRYGARPLRRAIQNNISDALSEQLLAGEIKDGDSVIADVDGDEIVIKIAQPEENLEALVEVN